MNESLDTLNQDNILLYIEALCKNVSQTNVLWTIKHDLKNFLKTKVWEQKADFLLHKNRFGKNALSLFKIKSFDNDLNFLILPSNALEYKHDICEEIPQANPNKVGPDKFYEILKLNKGHIILPIL